MATTAAAKKTDGSKKVKVHGNAVGLSATTYILVESIAKARGVSMMSLADSIIGEWMQKQFGGISLPDEYKFK